MNRRKSGFAYNFDWITFVLYIIMLIGGLISICGATYDFGSTRMFSMQSRPMMQIIWICSALLIGGAILFIETDFIETFAPIFYIIMMGILLVTIFIAPDIKGSHSWLVIGPIRLQPAEFAKVSTALILAWQINKYEFKIKTIRSYYILLSLIFLPIVLIIMQQETGSALVFIVFFLALYREGFSGLFLLLGFSATIYFVLSLLLKNVIWLSKTNASLFVITIIIYILTVILFMFYSKRSIQQRYAKFLILTPIIALLLSFFINVFFPFDLSYVSLILLVFLILFIGFIFLYESSIKYFLIILFALGSIGFYMSVGYVFQNILEPHQQVRIKVALGIEQDPRGKGYNVEQSKIAIGSGGLTGKGFLNGTQTKLSYVPEQATDFIFCTIGEEQGFLGSVALISLYGFFIIRIVYLAERQTTKFARIYGYSVASIFLFHVFINLGMVLGIVPVIGIPLPFFSYGGSSMWGFTMLLFIFLNLDARRSPN